MAPKIFNNWILNPFYQDPQDVEPDALAAHDPHMRASSPQDGEHYLPNENAKTDPFVNEDSASEEGSVTSTYQDGIRKAESVALVWSTTSLVAAYLGYAIPSQSVRGDWHR